MPCPRREQGLQGSRHQFADRRAGGGRILPQASDQAARQAHREHVLAVGDGERRGQPAGLAEVAIGLPGRDRELVCQASGGVRQVRAILQQRAGAIEPLDFLGLTDAGHMTYSIYDTCLKSTLPTELANTLELEVTFCVGGVISPLLANLYMRRFILGWKLSGHARRFGAEIVNYADDFVVCGKAPAEAMRAVVERMMQKLRLPVNETKTRCLRVPEEAMRFLGYRIGRNYSPRTGRAYLGTRPSKASVRSIGRKVSELTQARHGHLAPELVVERLNRALLGWANYFRLGQVSPAYRAVDAHVTKRLRQWLCRKYKVRTGQTVRYPDRKLWEELGLVRLRLRTASFPWAKA